jgi:RDD family protein
MTSGPNATKVDRREPVGPTSEAMPGAAGFWRRMAGFVVDVFLCFVLPSLVSSLILLASGYSSRTRIVDASWVLLLALIIVGYFAYFTLRAPSPGMRLAGIKILSTRSGEPPVVVQAVIRGLLMLCLIGSWFVVVLLGSGRAGSGGLSNAESLALNVGYVLFLVSAFGHVWISWDRKGQTVQDKLARIVVVRKDVAIEPVQQPKTHRIDPLEYRM